MQDHYPPFMDDRPVDRDIALEREAVSRLHVDEAIQDEPCLASIDDRIRRDVVVALGIPPLLIESLLVVGIQVNRRV